MAHTKGHLVSYEGKNRTTYCSKLEHFVKYVTLFRYQKCIGKAVVFISAQRTASAMGQYYERNPFIARSAAVSAFSATNFNIVSRTIMSSYHVSHGPAGFRAVELLMLMLLCLIGLSTVQNISRFYGIYWRCLENGDWLCQAVYIGKKVKSVLPFVVLLMLFLYMYIYSSQRQQT